MKNAEQLEEALQRAEEWLASVEPDTLDPDELTDLRALADANRRFVQARTDIFMGVDVARANGRSWAMIGNTLGISAQAAHERFSRPRATSWVSGQA